MTQIAVVTCYHDPDYVRARSLRAAVKAQTGVKLITVKNTHSGLRRYPETLWRMLKVKWRDKPATFLITFRGQEILPFVLLIAGRTPVWFDEFIVPNAYAKHEKHRKTLKKRLITILIQLSNPLYRFCLRRCKAILSDTPSHAELGAKMNQVNFRKYLPVPVSTDEHLFRPRAVAKKAKPLQIFYYTTNMQPLHGIPYVLEAAERLKDDERLQFVLVGGKKPMKTAVEAATARGARITYHSWIPFDELPSVMHASSLCLGGPFGGTPQAQHVITGKTYQSIACGVPTIVGNNLDVAGYFKDRVNALVIPQQSAEALAEACTWAADHPSELQQIGEKGRALYERHFSNKAIAQLLTPLIDTVKP